MKRTFRFGICMFLVLCLILPFPIHAAADTDTSGIDTFRKPTKISSDLPNVGGEYCFVYDSRQGLLTNRGGMYDKIYPASITKLYTAYVAMQILSPSAPVEATEELLAIPAWDSSKAHIQPGEVLTAEMLVAGMMLPSGNDAAYLLAYAAGKLLAGSGSDPVHAIDVFMETVNEYAQQDGLTGTHFVTPDGYHDENHYTCMQDLIQIAWLVLNDPVVSKYAATHRVTRTVPGEETEREWINTNLMLDPDSPYYRRDVKGLKTGYTSRAGNCLICVQRTQDGRYMIAGVFRCPTTRDRFVGANRMLITAENIKYPTAYLPVFTYIK